MGSIAVATAAVWMCYTLSRITHPQAFSQALLQTVSKIFGKDTAVNFKIKDYTLKKIKCLL